MEDERMETLSTYSDDEVGYKSNKSIRKSALVSSGDENESGSEGKLDKIEEKQEKEQSDSGVDDDSTVGNIQKKDRKFSRVKRYDPSDSDQDDIVGDLVKESRVRDRSNDNIDNLHSSQESHTKLDDIEVKADLTSDNSSENEHQDDSPRKGSNNSPPVQKKYQDLFKDDIYDAEGSSDEDINERPSNNFPNEVENESPVKKKPKSGKGVTKSRPNAKKSKETPSEIDEIHKETQRMVRESRVSLPYHVPRQRTLQDFLNRRKSVPKIPLKSNSEDLSIVWKHIEEREKTAESFYNSESDESDKEKETRKSTLTEELSVKECETENNTTLHLSITEKSAELKESTLSEFITAVDKNVDSTQLVITTETDSMDTEKLFENNQSNSDSGIHSMENSNPDKSDEKSEVSHMDIDEGIPCPKSSSVENNIDTKDIKMSENQNVNSDCDNCEVETTKSPSSEYTFFGVPIEDDGQNEEEVSINQTSKDEDIVDVSSKNVLGDTTDKDNNQFSSDNLTKSLLESLDKNAKEISGNNENLEGTRSEKQSNDKTLTPSCISLLNDTTVLDKVPKLSCGPGDEIDLDQPIGGANHLLKRFMKHAKLKTTVPKKKASVKLSVLSVESSAGGEVTSLTEEELIISSQETKPGQRLCALKQSLKKSIEESRSQLHAKRIEQYKIYEQEFYDEEGGNQKQIDEDDEFENEIFGDKDPDDDDGDKEKKSDDGENVEENGDEDEEEEDILSCAEIDDEEKPSKASKKKKSDFVDEEAEVSQDENEDSEEDEEDDRLSESYSVTQDSPDRSKTAKKSLEFEDEFSQDSPIKKLDLSGLGLDKESDEESDLLGLCSGKFQTQPVSLTQLEGNSSQVYNPCTPAIENIENQFSQEMFSQRSIKPVKIIDSDDEEKEDNNTQTIKSARNTKRLQFSDDEDEGEPVNREEDDDKGEESETEPTYEKAEGDDECSDEEINAETENEEMKVIHYDSEEEIVEGARFLDVEAELSGSEASEDEDEKGLSDFEADEADMEKINQSKLRSELGRIHMQDVMAQDKREIRLLQELLLEDGELHSDGPKRQRLFRWSNQEDSQNVLGKSALSDEESGAIDEEEEDHQWRKDRIEREQFLNSTRREDEAEVLDENVNLPVSDKKIIKQQTVPKIPTNLLSSPDPKQPFKLLTNRGSFLGRSERVLTKLAGMAAPTDQQQQRVKRNMVFSVVSPPKARDNPIPEMEKRKADESLPRVTKRLKFNQSVTKTTRSLGIIQKLMESDQAT